jgi:hypothetical protein
MEGEHVSLKVGSRLRTPTSTTEVIVVKAGAGDGELVCAGGVMTTEQVSPQPLSDGGTQIQLGKRYTDDDSGVEVLCTKPGAGPLMLDGRELTVKSATALPASD